MHKYKYFTFSLRLSCINFISKIIIMLCFELLPYIFVGGHIKLISTTRKYSVHL